VIEILLAIIALGVATANGANDNFKGFATVWGSEVLDYKRALYLATIATLAGSFAALWLAQGLVAQFSGRGLVSAQLASSSSFLLAVGFGVVITVSLATRLGFPISTTHALIGSMIGAGLAGEAALGWLALGQTFLLPLLLSPVVSVFLAWAFSAKLHKQAPDACACVEPISLVPQYASNPSLSLLATPHLVPHLVIKDASECNATPPEPKILLSTWLDRLHLASATSICFARAVNDTPKIAALLLAANFTQATSTMLWVGLAMAIGGFLGARRVAHTMSHRVSRMTPREGLLANIITAALVLLASKFALPVSTTHVSVGSIAGIGLRSGQLDKPALFSILLSWLATLPLAAASAFLFATA
jgi:inorganic phosphate transporter, PiT family